MNSDVIPTPSTSQAAVETDNGQEGIDPGDLITFPEPTVHAKDIVTELVDTGKGLKIGMPEGWRHEAIVDFVMKSDDFEYKNVFTLLIKADEGLTDQELVEQYQTNLTEVGGSGFDALSDLQVGEYTAIGILYQNENENLDHSRFLIRHDGTIYDLVFSCRPEQTVNFYPYIDAILQTVTFA